MGAAAVRRPVQLRGRWSPLALWPMKLAQGVPDPGAGPLRRSRPRRGRRSRRRLRTPEPWPPGAGGAAAHRPRGEAPRPLPEGRRRGRRGARRHAHPRRGTEGRRPAGLEVEVFREGREIKHPKTGAVLGRSRGGARRCPHHRRSRRPSRRPRFPSRAGVKVGDRFSRLVGQDPSGPAPAPGRRAREPDRGRHPGAGGASRQRRAASGWSMGDAHQRVSRPAGHQGRGVPPGQGRPGVGPAVPGRRTSSPSTSSGSRASRTWTSASSRSPRPEAVINTAFFVPSIDQAGRRRAAASRSAAGPANPPQAKPRSLLARLLGGDVEAGTYSSGEDAFPLRQVARASASRCWRSTSPSRPRTRFRAWWSATAIRSTCTGSSSGDSSPSGPSPCAAWGGSSPCSSPTSTGTGPRRHRQPVLAEVGLNSFILTLEGRQAPVPHGRTSPTSSSPSISRATASSRRCGPSASTRSISSRPARPSRSSSRTASS